MKRLWILFSIAALAAVVLLLVMLGEETSGTAPATTTASTREADREPVRLALVPERDIFAMRRRSRALADYIAEKIGRPVELVTGSSYQTALDDLREKRAEVALLGSLVTVLAVDRYDARVLLKTELVEGGSTYAGVICVAEESPVRDVEELAGKRVALVRATWAGNLFPVADFLRREMMEGEEAPKIVWVGTHDDAVLAMVEGVVDAAAVKDARLDAWVRANPRARVRVLARSREVPENTLVARADVADAVGAEIARVLLEMNQSPEGREALRQYGAVRFLPSSIKEYAPIYKLVEEMGEAWELLDVRGTAPKWRWGELEAAD